MTALTHHVQVMLMSRLCSCQRLKLVSSHPGHDAKDVPIQKTVPVIGTPADADLEQHEVSTVVSLQGAEVASCLLLVHWQE